MSRQTLIGKSFRLQLKCEYCGSETICTEANIYYHGLIGQRYLHYYAKFSWEVQCSNLKCARSIPIGEGLLPLPVIQKVLNRLSTTCEDHNGCKLSYIKKQCIGIAFLDGPNNVCNNCHSLQFFHYKDLPPEVIRHL
jgi:hypothetical protein